MRSYLALSASQWEVVSPFQPSNEKLSCHFRHPMRSCLAISAIQWEVVLPFPPSNEKLSCHFCYPMRSCLAVSAIQWKVVLLFLSANKKRSCSFHQPIRRWFSLVGSRSRVVNYWPLIWMESIWLQKGHSIFSQPHWKYILVILLGYIYALYTSIDISYAHSTVYKCRARGLHCTIYICLHCSKLHCLC